MSFRNSKYNSFSGFTYLCFLCWLNFAPMCTCRLFMWFHILEVPFEYLNVHLHNKHYMKFAFRFLEIFPTFTSHDESWLVKQFSFVCVDRKFGAHRNPMLPELFVKMYKRRILIILDQRKCTRLLRLDTVINNNWVCLI